MKWTVTPNTRLRQLVCCLVLLASFQQVKAQGRVLINEYLPWPNNACGATAEFIELYNFGPGPVNIGGYIVTDGEYAITISAKTILEAGEFYVLAGQNVIPRNCGNDNRNVTVNLNWNTCGCTSGLIPVTGEGMLTDGGTSNEQIVLLDPPIDPRYDQRFFAAIQPAPPVTWYRIRLLTHDGATFTRRS